MKNEGCPHLRRQLGRVVFADGSTHRVEMCLDCGHNARGPGVWVAKSEHYESVDDLQLLPNYQQAAQRHWSQPSLFDGM